MRLPEKWRCRDGRLLRIRSMSNAHLAAASDMLRKKGYLSYVEWKNQMPQAPYGTGQMGDATEYYAELQFSSEWETWLAKKHHIALDAFAAEIGYRRRHRIVIEDDLPSVMAERNGEL